MNPETGQPCTGEEQDPLDHGARSWDALIQVAKHSLDTDLQPGAHGAQPRVTVLVDYDQLKDQLNEQLADEYERARAAGLAHPDQPGAPVVPVTEDGIELSPATVRRVACDAEVIAAVFGPQGQVLDLGQSRRLVSAALSAALVVRDRHCSFPGCDRPPIMCHGHHIVHWADDGPTNLDNLVMLCGHHHRVIHHSPWEVRIDPHDRLPEFLPPPKPGRPREWIRHRPRLE